ncbi:MAG: hypothetical protein IPM89_13390 [Candidatus Competibacteraceae bacterium]|nr:MAG: hypothetical protein IPM89_13390 [Candidatus Competibacteraceae bacterium]
MPTRILIRLSLLAGLVAPLCAFALGVGPLEVRSALNQNFEAEIPLISSNPVELIGLTVRIPRQQDFDWAGAERYEFLSKLRFSVQTPPGGPNLLKITSTEPLREPNFTLLVELAWPRGRLLRGFPVQLDPELYADRRLPPPPPPPVVVPPPIAAEPAAAEPPAPGLPPAPPVSFEGARSWPVKSGETLMGIASQVRPSTAVKLPEMMAILVAGNPGAFVNGNPNALRAGSVLKVPTPQALGVQGVPTPPVPDVAAAAPTESTPTQLPPTTPIPPRLVEPSAQAVVSSPEPAPEPEPPPLATTTTPLVEPQPLPVPVEPLREIIPQASIPQTEGETSPTPIDAASEAQPAAQPEPPPPVAQPEPASVRPPPTAKPPAAQPEENGFSWLANPIVWIAIAMIVLAVAAVVLLPLLRRPAKPKQPPVQPEAIDEPKPTPESSTPMTRTQIREPRSVRPRPAVASSTTPASAETGAMPAASKPAASKPEATPPKPIDELLKDIDFGLGDAAVSGKEAASAQKLETPRLPDTEPPTASVTRTAANPFLSAEPASDKVPAQSPQADLPSELRLDNLDFDFGDLGLENTARPKTDLPPLELGPAKSSATANPPPRAPDTFEPMTEPPAPPAPPLQIEPLSMPPPSRQFEFTDITQELEQPGASVEPLKLDEDLRGIGDGSLDLGTMVSDSASTPGGGNRETAADYVETKLDLATAYLDMGDQVGARSLLEEALQEGTASQQQQARELLKKLG